MHKWIKTGIFWHHYTSRNRPEPSFQSLSNVCIHILIEAIHIWIPILDRSLVKNIQSRLTFFKYVRRDIESEFENIAIQENECNNILIIP